MKNITTSISRNAVLSLIIGLSAVFVAPIAGAVSVDQVDLIDGRVDVNEDLIIDQRDDLPNVALWCNDSAPVRVDIFNGLIDVTEGGGVNGSDDLVNCDLTDEVGGAGVPTTNQVDIINGFVDENENGVANLGDDATNIQLFVLP